MKIKLVILQINWRIGT